MISNLGNNSKQTCFEDGNQAQYVRHPSSSQWTLTASRRGIWTSKLEIHIPTCMFSNFVHCCCCCCCCLFIFYFLKFIKGLHPSHHPNSVKTRFSLAAPTQWLQLCDHWIFSNFVGMIKNTIVPTPSLWSWILHASGRSKQMLMIVSSIALNIKGGMIIPSAL